jgi:tRNA(Ser,Leu) C12 N-acetylase TAN1
MLSDFNLVVSTARDYEQQCECELWFNLMALGDSTPIVTRPGIPGLLLVKTSIEPRKLIHHLRDIITNKDLNYIQFIAKIYPIDVVVETDMDTIAQAAVSLVENHPIAKDKTTKYRITIRKRQCENSTDEIIKKVASLINNPVSLKEYDWNLEIEIINKYAGLAIITDEDIFAPIQEKRLLNIQPVTEIFE